MTYQRAKLRGDPGLLGSLGKLATKVAPKLLKGLPVIGSVIAAGSIAKDVYDTVYANPTDVPRPPGAPPAAATPSKSAKLVKTDDPYGQFRVDVDTMSWPAVAQKWGMTVDAAMALSDKIGRTGSPVAAGMMGTGMKIVKKYGPAAIGVGSTALGLYEGFKGMFGGNGDAIPAGYHRNKVMVRYAVAQANGKDVQDPTEEPRVKNEIVRNRSMNVLNPRALKRAWMRAEGAKKWARKLVKFERKAKVRIGKKR